MVRYRPMYSDKKAVSPVIAVILLVGITVVLVATLYFTVNNLIQESRTTPRVGFYFRESTEVNGFYTGHIVMPSSRVYIEDVSITIIDFETSASGVISPLSDGASVHIGPQDSGMNITFYDYGLIGQLDGSDIFQLYNGTKGDRINMIYLPTYGAMGTTQLET